MIIDCHCHAGEGDGLDVSGRGKNLVGHAGLAFRTRNPATTLIW